MNKKLLISLAAAAAIIGGVIFLAVSPADQSVRQATTRTAEQRSGTGTPSPAPTAEPGTPAPAANPATPNGGTTPPAAAAGSYRDYSSQAVAETSGTRLLFFHAPWCPQCRALEADIKRQGVPAGVTIFKVDYDSNQQLRQQYGVTIQTTVVRLDANGGLAEKYVSYDEPTMASVRENLL